MQTGDLIFSFIGSEQNAISDVTEGFRGARVNHLGVVVKTQRGTFVLEAFPPEVRLTEFGVFSRRSRDEFNKPRLIFARLQVAFRPLIPEAMSYGIAQRDIPYDELYLTGEDTLYCSELVVDMFKHSNGGQTFFAESPMSFRDNATGEVHPSWRSYYEYYGMDVPEGQPGSNPGDISRDERLEIIEVVGNIPGLI